MKDVSNGLIFHLSPILGELVIAVVYQTGLWGFAFESVVLGGESTSPGGVFGNAELQAHPRPTES